MILRVIIRSAARAELESDAEFYEQRRASLGREFVREVHEAIARVRTRPDTFPVAAGDVRRIRVLRFPYSVFYRFRNPKIEVLAIFHDSRNPAIWQKRT